MIYRIFPSKDTFITNQRVTNVPQTSSNFGASEILNSFVIGYQSSSFGMISGSSGRILMKFDLTDFLTLSQQGNLPLDRTSYRLRLKDAPHNCTLPSSFDMEILPLATDWDEGTGLDNDTFTDRGYANWDRAKSSVFWNQPGGDVIASPYSIAHFDRGDEDISTDVTNIVRAWMSGTIFNNGFMIRMSSSLESGSLDYYVKMFHSRETNFGDRLPYLEASWDDSIKDDRNNFLFDVPGNLYLYHRTRGALSNISGVGTGSLNVSVGDASGTLFQTTGTYVSPGIYSASFTLPTGSYSGSVFHDRWESGSQIFSIGDFTPQPDSYSNEMGSIPYFVNVTNLKNEYESDEFVRMNVFVRQRDYNPAVYLTASSGPTGEVITKAYYRIDNDRTNEIVVPFGTGSENTRLSYDGNGNYFKFYMRNLPAGNVYRLLLLFDVDGEKKLIDNNFKFRVE